MDDDEIVKLVLDEYWYHKRYAISRNGFEAALRLAMEKAREDNDEQHRYDGHGEDA